MCEEGGELRLEAGEGGGELLLPGSGEAGGQLSVHQQASHHQHTAPTFKQRKGHFIAGRELMS